MSENETDQDKNQQDNLSNKSSNGENSGDQGSIEGNGVEQNEEEARRLFKLAGFDPDEM